MESSAVRQIGYAVLLLAMTPVGARAVDCSAIAEVAQTGDLIFRFENSWISRAVIAYQGDQGGQGYSHVGVVIKKAGDNTVFHAEYDPSRFLDGVVSESVCEYLSRAKRSSLRRWRGVTEQARHGIERAVRSIGPRKFNLKLLGQSSTGALYCTQYVVEIFAQVVGRDLFRVEPKSIITVKQIADSDILDQVALFPPSVAITVKE